MGLQTPGLSASDLLLPCVLLDCDNHPGVYSPGRAALLPLPAPCATFPLYLLISSHKTLSKVDLEVSTLPVQLKSYWRQADGVIVMDNMATVNLAENLV